jgi:hypothetical protein
MKLFSDLLKPMPGIDPGTQQRIARKDFRSMLARTRLIPWDHAASSPKGRRIVIGVAAGFSTPDLQLLDALNAAIARDNLGRVEVFDAQDCRVQGDFEDRIPGIGKVYHTPVLGVWENGNLVMQGSAAAGRRIVLQLIGGPAEGLPEADD